MAQMWTIQEVAKATGTTSRTLRHYDAIGVLSPTAVGENGYRLYDDAALIRLQRILALRDLGLGLPEIARVLDDGLPEEEALADLEQRLQREAMRLDRQIASVRRTREALVKGRSPMTENMFDGFDHSEYQEEVEERWGKQAWQQSNNWWSSLGEQGQAEWKGRMHQLGLDWIAAVERKESPESPAAQELAERHVTWLRSIPGTPAHEEGGDLAGYLLGLGEMYVSDPRFAANYGGAEGATLVRDALKIYAENIL